MGSRLWQIIFATSLVTLLGAGISTGGNSMSFLWKCPDLSLNGEICIPWINISPCLEDFTNTDIANNIITEEPGVEVCRTGLKKPVFEREPQKWQEVENRKIVVFSAFYEWREEADGPAIRIIGAGYQAAYNNIGNIYCQLWYEKEPLAVSVSLVKYEVIYPSTLHPDAWSSHFIICKLPKTLKHVPYAVSVSAEPCGTPTNHLMVLNREGPQNKEGFALCYPTLYNYFKLWPMLIEMMEMQHILGIKEIFIYEQSIGADAVNVVNDLKKQGKLNLITWKFPNIKCNVFAQRGALNDCLYRVMPKYKYVLVHDLDEVLVPRKTSYLPDLMEIIEKPTYGAYLFQHAYFRRNNTLNADPQLITQTSFWRTDKVIPPGKIRCKSMYYSEKAVCLDLHFPYKLIPGAEEYILPPEVGILHHYRATPMESFNKYPERYRYIEDRYMEQYNDTLIQAYNKTLSQLNLN